MAELPHPALAELASIQQWTAWQKDTKLPLHPKTLKPYAKGQNIPAHLTTLASVKGLLVGFYSVATDDYILLDLDKVRDPGTGKVVDWAEALVRLLDSYTEVSPSGTGLHIIIRCRAKPRDGYVVQKYGGAKIEVRVNTQYITITGDAIHGDRIKEHPREILDHPLFRAANGAAGEAPRHRTGGRAEAKLDIIVAAERGLSARTLMALQENHPDFWRFWRKSAIPARDATHSGYMASIARRLASMGKDDQFIADALVDYCHAHGRPDKIDQREIERCITLARSDAGDVGDKPEALQAQLDKVAEEEAIDGAEDKRGEALRILGSYFRMPITDIRRFGKTPGRVQLLNCEEWLDIGTPAQVLDQKQVLTTIYHVKGIVVLRAKPERWARIATLIAQHWRIEEPGDEEDAQRLDGLIEEEFFSAAGRGVEVSSLEAAFTARAGKIAHRWNGEQFIFSGPLRGTAKLAGIERLYERLHEIGFRPSMQKLKSGSTTRCWVRQIR